MIEIRNLYKSFEGKTVIKNLSLTVNEGERIAIIGPSGCGKSTLLRLLIGLDRPDSGKILVLGKDITKINGQQLKALRLKFGMLFQSSALFDSMNVQENVGFSLVENFNLSRRQVLEKVREKLAMVDMSGTEDLFPADLSGGMKKRIGLARAIAADPQVMLYDEPTTGLDPILSTNIEDLIVKLAEQLGMTSIVVTHQRSTILRAADKIYLMQDGKLLEAETPQSILNSKNEYLQYFISGGEI